MDPGRLRAFCQALIGRASPMVEQALDASFDERLASTIDLVEHNEAVIGLENLLSNLGDFEVNLSPRERAELEQIIAGFGGHLRCPLRYQVIFWHHQFADEPVLLFSEIGVDGFEIRKIEEYASGHQDVAGMGIQQGTTQLGEVPVPPIAEVVLGTEFEGHSLTSAEFEAVWVQATKGAGPSS